MRRFFHGSLTRIADLATTPFTVQPIDRANWEEGDYLAARVLALGPAGRIELPNGRLTSLEIGDALLGSLGVRHATLEATGDWRATGPDLELDLLTGAGLLGRATSVSAALAPLTHLAYEGHVVRNGQPVRMRDFVPPMDATAWRTPTILIIGTSMSAGKTTAARICIRHLVRHGVRITGAKLTGAGRYRDILSMRDAGATTIVDFVDAGLPSTICDEAVFRRALAVMLARIQDSSPDVAIIEAGASPLEPYNGAAAIAALGDAVRLVILAASDPYAAYGVMEGFGVRADLVTGIAANTQGGIDLVERLTGVRAINVRDPDTADELAAILAEAVRRPA